MLPGRRFGLHHLFLFRWAFLLVLVALLVVGVIAVARTWRHPR